MHYLQAAAELNVMLLLTPSMQGYKLTNYLSKFTLPLAMSIGILCVFAIKYYAPKIKNPFGEPSRCTSLIKANETVEYCLDEKYRVPLECIFNESEKATERCEMLSQLSERNKIGFSFSIIGYKVEVNKILE